MTIPFREVREEDAAIIQIEAKKNKKKCVIFIVFGALALIVCVGVGIYQFCDFEPVMGALAVFVGLFFGGISVFLGITSRKPITGICETTVADKNFVRTQGGEGESESTSYYISFAIPGTEEQYKTGVDTRYYKAAEIGAKAYLMRTAKGKILVYVPTKAEREFIARNE